MGDYSTVWQRRPIPTMVLALAGEIFFQRIKSTVYNTESFISMILNPSLLMKEETKRLKLIK